jgi:hypothetical protein
MWQLYISITRDTYHDIFKSFEVEKVLRVNSKNFHGPDYKRSLVGYGPRAASCITLAFVIERQVHFDLG